jgi:hypothetical protein
MMSVSTRTTDATVTSGPPTWWLRGAAGVLGSVGLAYAAWRWWSSRSQSGDEAEVCVCARMHALMLAAAIHDRHRNCKPLG